MSRFDHITRAKGKKGKERLSIVAEESRVIAQSEREIVKGEEECRRFFLPRDELEDPVESIEVKSPRMPDGLPEVQFLHPTIHILYFL